MENENMVTEGVETEVEDTVSDVETEDVDIDIDDLEYDDEGNIIIPDDEEFIAEDDPDEDKESEPADVTSDDTAKEPPKANMHEAEEERKKRESLENAVRDALSAMGIEVDDVRDGLIRVAAEATGVTEEEYREKRRAAEAIKRVEQLDYEALARSDLAELQALYPETKEFTSLVEIPNVREFAKLREMGLSPKQAYAAANPDLIRSRAATAARRNTDEGGKSHLHTVVPKANSERGTSMTKAQMDDFRELFPDLSDKEIVALFKKTK